MSCFPVLFENKSNALSRDIVKRTRRASEKKKKVIEIMQIWIPFVEDFGVRFITASAGMFSSTCLLGFLPSPLWGVGEREGILLLLFSRILILTHISCLLLYCLFRSLQELVTGLVKVLDNLAEFHLHRRMWDSHLNSGLNSTIVTRTKITPSSCEHESFLIFCFRGKWKLNFYYFSAFAEAF